MSPLLIQTAIITGGIVVGILIVIGLPIVLGLRHSQRTREFEHVERMKALEVGRPMPGESASNASGQSAAGSSPAKSIGLVVPLGALGIAWLASSTPWSSSVAISFIWTSACVVGVAGVVCGTILQLRSQQEAQQSQTMHNGTKTAYDPDAYDVVSRRG